MRLTERQPVNFDGLPFFMSLLLFLLFLHAVLALAFCGAEQAVMLLSNKHFPAILAHVDWVIRIREHEAEYQRDRQHQGTPSPGWCSVRTAARRCITIGGSATR